MLSLAEVEWQALNLTVVSTDSVFRDPKQTWRHPCLQAVQCAETVAPFIIGYKRRCGAAGAGRERLLAMIGLPAYAMC
jgi:hypothetical protein